jgi:ubiquinone biosynthesis accessory factor UbiJ
MATSSPFPFNVPLFDDLVSKITSLQPPAWAVDEVQQRLVLLLNHVLMQEPEATVRLARLKGRVVRVQWRTLSMTLAATPAGLLERATSDAVADLSLLVADESPFTILQTALNGGKPSIKIEGDVQLAAEVNWLADHVRWDVEEDLSRILGDAPAHALISTVKQIVDGLKSFLVSKVADADVVNTSVNSSVNSSVQVAAKAAE